MRMTFFLWGDSMDIDMHAASVPVFSQMLGSLDALLEKAEAHAAANGRADAVDIEGGDAQFRHGRRHGGDTGLSAQPACSGGDYAGVTSLRSCA